MAEEQCERLIELQRLVVNKSVVLVFMGKTLYHGKAECMNRFDSPTRHRTKRFLMHPQRKTDRARTPIKWIVPYPRKDRSILKRAKPNP